MIEVTGRNGSTYNATHIKSNLYVVGKFIVSVVNGKCVDTICKATKANVSKMK